MSQSHEAGRKSAHVSAQAGTAQKTAYDSGYKSPESAAKYNAGVAQGKKEVSKQKG